MQGAAYFCITFPLSSSLCCRTEFVRSWEEMKQLYPHLKLFRETRSCCPLFFLSLHFCASVWASWGLHPPSSSMDLEFCLYVFPSDLWIECFSCDLRNWAFQIKSHLEFCAQPSPRCARESAQSFFFSGQVFYFSCFPWLCWRPQKSQHIVKLLLWETTQQDSQGL